MRVWTKVEEPMDVRVLVPYVKSNHRLQTVVDCLRIQFVQPELHKVNDGDAYWRLLDETWRQGREFFVVEHDVIAWPGAIGTMQACPEPWCTLGLLCHGRLITTTLGCVKFGAVLMEREPEFWSDIPKTWFHLDANSSSRLGWPDIRPCVHEPPGIHLNEVQWPDSISKRWAVSRKVVWQSMEAGGEPVARMSYKQEEAR